MKPDPKMQWVAVVTMPAGWTPPEERKYHGDGRDILLQGFHWDSHRGVPDGENHFKSWYRILRENVESIKKAGFTWIWLPPASDSLAPQGYIPRRWNVLDTPYGNEAELRALLAALDPVKALADVVLNHRVGVRTGGADFEDPPFPDNRAAIVRDDESGVGTGAYDTGERYPAGRDLDHTNPGVRAAIKNYLQRLRQVGFKGWRYDLVKGYHGRFIGEYNDASHPLFSVGEYFDTDRQHVTNWIDATGGKSCAFDFPTRYILHHACHSDDYSGLRSTNNGRTVPGGLIGFWPSRAVTFLDNHDTEYRREKEHIANHDSTRHFYGTAVERGYAYLLTHPGIPCVFWSHFFDWGASTRRKLERLIRLRKALGLHATSHVDIRVACKGLYAAVVDGKVAVKLGSREWSPGHGWRVVLDGDRFAVWIPWHASEADLD
jgi:alpha-amylase